MSTELRIGVDSLEKMQYRQEIDGLRAVAVTVVILNHLHGSLLPSGFLGVDIFFVVSGYVITASLLRTTQTSLKDFLLTFYSQRIKRLVPALALVVLLTSVALSLFDPAPVTQLKTGLFSLIGFSNVYLIGIQADYFGDSIALNAFTHTWSLGVEEQFYLVFPILLWVLHARNPSASAAWISGVLVILTAISLLLFAILYASQSDLVYYSMPTRFWELAVGALTFFAMRRRSQCVAPNLGAVVSSIAFVGLIAAMFVPKAYFVPNALAVVMLTACLIYFTRQGMLTHRVLASNGFVYVGLISYSLYLWHWPVLTLSRWTIGINGYTAPFLIVLMLLLASLSYRYLERPLRSRNWSTNRAHTIGYGLAGSAAVGIVLALLLNPLYEKMFSGKHPNLISAGIPTLKAPYAIAGASGGWAGDACVLSSNRDVGKEIQLSTCTLGDFQTAANRVLVVGNSFSAAFTQAFDNLVRQDDHAVMITSSWGASVVPTIKNTSPWNKANDYYWETLIPSLVSQLKQGDWVFLVNDMETFSPKQNSPTAGEQLRLLAQGLEVLSAQLEQAGVRLAVLSGLPFARDATCAPAAAIRQWYTPFGNPACTFYSKVETLARRQNLHAMLLQLEASGVLHVVDLLGVFCDAAVCTYETSDGVVLYRDAWSHPSVEAARLSADTIRGVLLQ